MAFKLIGGQAVFESAGPLWRLAGHVERDRRNHSALVLSRQVDESSPKIRAMNGRMIANVDITDLKGKSLNLSYDPTPCGAKAEDWRVISVRSSRSKRHRDS